AEQVREDGIHRLAGKVLHPEEVMSLLRDPVWRVHEQHVGPELVQRPARALVGPAQLLPAALRSRLVLGWILAVDEVRGMRGQGAGQDAALGHAGSPRVAPEGEGLEGTAFISMRRCGCGSWCTATVVRHGPFSSKNSPYTSL